jgi:hypothetical protein
MSATLFPSICAGVNKLYELGICAIASALPHRLWYRQREKRANVFRDGFHWNQRSALGDKPAHMEVNKDQFQKFFLGGGHRLRK